MGDPALVVRPADVADARAIAQVHVASWRWAYRGIVPQAALDALDVDAREETWRTSLAWPVERLGAVVAERDGAVVGFASTGPAREATAPAGPAWGELYAIYVTRDAAGNGVGAALLRAAERSLADAAFPRALLWVLEANGRARRFYEREGWTYDGARGTYEVGSTALPTVRYVRPLRQPR